MKKTKQFAAQAILVTLLTLCVMCLAVFAQTTNCYADEISTAVGSIAAKEAPSTEKAEVVDNKGQAEVIDLGLITSVSHAGAKEKAKTDDGYTVVVERLDVALSEIQTAEKKEDLQKALTAAAQAISKDYSADCLEATDLFDVTVDSTIQAKMAEGYKVKITFESPSFSNVSATNPLVVAQKVNDDWKTVDAANIEYLGNKQVAVTFDHFCPIAFLKVNAKNVEIVKETTPVKEACCDCCSEHCPFCPALCSETGCFCWVVYVAIALAVVLVVLSVILIVKKVKDQKKDSNDILGGEELIDAGLTSDKDDAIMSDKE